MKQYFCKYLPVEGEINNGDSVLSIEGQIVHNVLVEETATHEPEYSIDKGDKKAKPYLCTRNIQMRDKVRLPGNSTVEWHTDETNTPHISIEYAKQIDCFKVIGEISPEAIWVKEGQEFDEEEIGLIYNKKFVGMLVSEEVNKRNALALLTHSTYKVGIKGPCGHFH